MPTKITLYSKPRCVQCDATVRALDEKKIPFTKLDVSVDADAFAFVKSLGYGQAPVVYVETPGLPDAHWSGFRPDDLKNLEALEYLIETD